MTWEAEFVGGELDGAVRTFAGEEPPPFLTVEVRPPLDWAAEFVPAPVVLRYRAEMCMDLERPVWRLVLGR